MGRGLFCALAVLLYSLPASAATETYNFFSGYIDVTSTAGTDLVLDERIDLDGDFVVFDDAAPSLVSFRFTAPTTPTLTLLTPYGGFDTLVIESLELTPGTAYASAGTQLTATTYSLNSGPIRVQSVYSASDSNNVNPPASNIALDFETATLSSTVDLGIVMFELTGLTIGVIDGTPFGETDPLIVKGDVTFVGVVPEPSTATMLGLGLAALAWRRRRSRWR
jgi:hypothetical protein